jgi:hypothetical protein
MKLRQSVWIIVLLLIVSAGAGMVSANQLPPAPTLISPANGATGVPSSPTLEWEAVPGATSYHLQIIELSAFWGFPVLEIVDHWSVPTNSYQPGHLPSLNQYAEPGSYQWRVRARTSPGVLGPWSETWSFSIAPDPIQPPNLKAPADGAVNQPTTITLEWWMASTGWSPITVTYHMQVATDAEFTSLVADFPGLDHWARSHTVSGLSPSTTYFWRVTALNPQRPTAGWSTRSFTTAP